MNLNRVPPDRTDEVLLAVGVSLWLVAVVLQWPAALSFSDEIAYVGQAKLLLQGHMRPLADSPGMWREGPTGWVAQYPYLVPILIAPLVALAPRLVFISGIASALGITWVASRALRAWGRRPVWALVVLAHPSVILMSRTMMADLILSAFAVAAWWCIRSGRRAGIVVFLSLLAGTKAVGLTLAGALVAGEALRSLRPLLARERAAVTRLAWAGGGLAAGLVVVMALNFAAGGKLGYGYDYRFLGEPPFAAKNLLTTGPKHALTLLLMPPLLGLGAWPLWKRRELGPLLLVGGFSAMMFTYYFVDSGRVWYESMILSPRLILPVVVFLLIGYADLLAGWAGRLAARRSVALARWSPLFVLVPAAVALAISYQHRRWQEPNRVARVAAAAVADQLGVHELGLTYSALKAGMLFRGQTVGVVTGGPPVILCSKLPASYRAPEPASTCDFAGYETRVDAEGFRVLVRRSP